MPPPKKSARVPPQLKSRHDLPAALSARTESLPAAIDPLQRYLQDVNSYPLLSLEEEAAIARHYKKYHDKTSAQKLALSNLRLVVKIAIEYKNAFFNLLDLIQEGNLGLLRAVEKYDPDRGVRFSSYAAWWVRAYILKYILDNFRLVKIGTTQAQKKLFFNLMKEKDRIEKLGFRATARLLSNTLDVKESEVQEMEIRLGQREYELDAPHGADSDRLNMDFVAAAGEPADEAIERGQLKDILMKNLEEFTRSLGDKEKNVFSSRLFSAVPSTLQEIAEQHNISRERIRQIEGKVVKKMREFFKAKGFNIDVTQLEQKQNSS